MRVSIHRMVVLNREWEPLLALSMVGSFRMELQSLAHRICHMEDPDLSSMCQTSDIIRE